MNANASGKAKSNWLAFDRLDYLVTVIALGIAVVGSVVAGIVIALIGEVFLRGVALRDDVEGLV